ncbi:MAG: 2TM domain-containing protein [Actinobacteria bacterium]|nr:2TM domain-containing protein [Actinomycetota bacterium]
MDTTQEDKQRMARHRVAELKGFYSNLISFIVVNMFLIAVNLITSPDSLWFYWVTIFWGAAVILHAVNVFALNGSMLGSKWEEKKMKDIMNDK